ncbi:MAG: metal ABC transporter permease [Armatimonadetes bacterium]|nr:metal ABC transporter permease [Armatimonadota bacterium]
MVLTAVTVVVSIKVVGVVLVSAMLVIPAAAAAQLSARWQWMLIFAAVMGVGSILMGLSVSFASDVATGPAAVLAATGFFAVATLVGRLVQRRTNASTESVYLMAADGLPRVVEG